MRKTWVVVVILFLIPSVLSEEVEMVFDGDTLLLENGEKVRLIGIDAPECSSVTDPAEFEGLDEDYLYEWAVKAKLYLEDRVLYEEISLVYDWEKRDEYGRILAYVYVNGEMINRTMIEKGYARATPEFSFKYREEFVQLEDEAKQENRGMWSSTDNEKNLAPYVIAVVAGLLALMVFAKLK